MIFVVSAVPYLQVHDASSTNVKHLIRKLTDIGIGGIQVSCIDPERNPNRTTSSQEIIDCALQAGLRICAHAPAPDISATDMATRSSAVTCVQRAITNLGSSLPGVVVTVHPENFCTASPSW